jgi:hypothetical protein
MKLTNASKAQFYMYCTYCSLQLVLTIEECTYLYCIFHAKSRMTCLCFIRLKCTVKVLFNHIKNDRGMTPLQEANQYKAINFNFWPHFAS